MLIEGQKRVPLEVISVFFGNQSVENWSKMKIYAILEEMKSFFFVFLFFS